MHYLYSYRLAICIWTSALGTCHAVCMTA